MIEFVVSGEEERRISDFESEMFDEYKKIADSYLPFFTQNGYTLKLGQKWRNSVHGTWSPCRLPLKNGYECYIYCEVQKDGKEVRIKSTDGEADYYILAADWGISYISRRFFKLKVSLCSAIDDVDDDLRDFLSQLGHLKST